MQSAGILVYRLAKNGRPEIFLVHPGGPFFARKDAGVWTIPKGGANSGEDAMSAAIREFEEETGTSLNGDFIALGIVKQKAGKLVEAWAIETDIDASKIISNQFEIEWPPKSGKKRSYPEADRAAWFTPEEAKLKINAAQAELIDRLLIHLRLQ
ncbi:MAG: NUDIX domain-containing protein [Chitinophagaceae bacterium]|nr:MAG: NUDIX domain-containing protein [Chitinophagaceae bacterium]